MQLTLIKKNEIYSCVLPEKKSGQYWVTQINKHGDEERVISIEGIDDKWILKSNRNSIIKDDNKQKVKEISIEPLKFYNIFLENTNESVMLYSESITDDRRFFQKLKLPGKGKLTIGRSKDCDIFYSNIFVSSRHAEIIHEGDELIIKDLNSSNGTFVNGSRIKDKNKVLKPGDQIYIMGLKIIVSKDFLAINNPDGQMTYNNEVLQRYEKQNAKPYEEDIENIEDKIDTSNLFYRSPRFKKDIEKAQFKIDPPPTAVKLEQTPLALMLGPAITMGLTSLFTGLLTLQNVMRSDGNIMSAMPTLMMSLSMLLGTILWPLLTKQYEKKKRIEHEDLRQEKYKKYLEGIRQDIAEECSKQSAILNKNYVTVDDCAQRIKSRSITLWERTLEQDDSLKVRLGVGELPLEAEIKYPEKKFTMDDDSLIKELYKLVEEPKVLETVPITLSLTEKYVSGIIGSRNDVTAFVKGLIVQLAALHSYDELKFVFIYDKKEQEIWDFVKWLPHVWNNEKTVRFVASNHSEVKELSSFFESEIVKRESITNEDELKSVRPYYVIFAMSRDLAGKAEMVNSILKHKKNYGFSLVTLYDELKNLPKECSIVVELEKNKSKIYDKKNITDEPVKFQPDIYLKDNIEELAISLANTQLDISSQTYNLPNMLTFLEMFGVGKIEHLNALSRWKENNPTISLETEIGVDTTGELLKLDLHEKFHGPHGLIAGMTGSGKSEFIMTFILSLALNYHPDEVAFILIDYKGGGMANAFEELPHLAGTITNLDGAAVKRSLISIQSELKRRQAIFSETSKKVNVSNIDIYKYQKLYRDRVVSEPLQHLFIISDEFAELKTQQPEFMEQLVSAARIGRSLGVHLILATQKPSGVVDDQIWSNSKFRICLKVQEKADSMDVIKRPDAAELSVTGRFFVQVGFNEVFDLGQSAWGGAPYYPVDRIEKNKNESVEVIDNLGRIIKQAKKDKYASYAKNPPKQIDETIKYLSRLAKDEDIKVKPLWLEPIPEMIYWDELITKYGVSKASKGIINPIIGEIDDPANQRQIVMTLPITKEGNTVVYGAAGSGKTTLLTTLIYSMVQNHTPAELNLYILDFGSETLRSFSKAPHVGEVLLSHEAEKINNLFKMLNSEIEKRKKLFTDYGGDYQSYIRTSGKEMESIVVIIHNYSAFAETYESSEDVVAYLTREGVKYGIYFIVTALNTNAIRFRLLQNFRQLYVLQLNDPQDYTGVLGNVDGVFPSKYKGRGIFKSDAIYEFQIAHISQNAVNSMEFIKSYCSEYSKKWGSAHAKKIPILPEKIDAEYLINEIKYAPGNKIPVGIEKNSLNVSYYDFDNYTVNLVLSQNNNEADFIQGLAEAIVAKGNSKVLVIDPEGRFEADEMTKYEYIDTGLDKVITRLFSLMVNRNNLYKDTKAEGKTLPTFDRMTCIINSLSVLMERISEESKGNLRLILEKGELEYNVRFIITDSASNISMVAYDNWFTARVSLSDAIWVGNGITEQYNLKISNTNNDMYQEIGHDFGYVINKGKVSLIKLLTSSVDNEEVELVG
jgi:DNA segregation ATPase FtsK/SpoIIIE, S-DNA-T family